MKKETPIYVNVRLAQLGNYSDIISKQTFKMALDKETLTVEDLELVIAKAKEFIDIATMLKDNIKEGKI